MDERTWLAATDAYAMLDELFPQNGVESIEPQPRPSRLYLIASARQARDQLPAVCRVVANLAERVFGSRTMNRVLRDQVYPMVEALVHCRGEVEELNAIGRELVSRGYATPNELRGAADVAPELWVGFSHLAFFPFSRSLPHFRRVPIELHSANLIREVFGNPFHRLPPVLAAWRTESVHHLAHQAHATADFSILPVLADALEDAGCDQRTILDHLRSGEPHARGCWALEWVLTEPRV